MGILLTSVMAMWSVTELALCNMCPAPQWRLMQSSCLPDFVPPVLQLHAADMQQCLFAGNRLSGFLLAQLNSNTKQCSVFHYNSVCHLLHSAPAPAQPAQCSVYSNVPVSDVMAAKQMQQKMRAAWVFGASGQANASLVCVFSPLWQQEGAILLRSDGAQLNGQSDALTLGFDLGGVHFGNFSNGFTWLLRLKRQPRKQILLKQIACDGSSTAGANFWELDDAVLRVSAFSQFTPNLKRTGNQPVLINDANRFINIGITAVPAASQYTFFYEDKFLPDSMSVLGNADIPTAASQYNCFLLGRKPSGHSNSNLNGTVRAVGIANHSMTEREIMSFFEMVELQQI